MVICDVCPRDGLQNERRVLAPSVRAELCGRLAAAGLARVEAVSMVNPRLVPAMAGAEEVLALLEPGSPTVYSGLVLNERGFERAIAGGLRHVNYTLAVTESFCQRNQGCSRAEAEARVAGFAAAAAAAGATLTVTLAVSFGCPFEGRVSESETLAVAERVTAAGAEEVVVADTIGVAVPSAVSSMVRGLEGLGVPIGAHFHDTRNTGVANVVAALEGGVRLFDAAAGGFGGCPFAPGATGNVATDDLVFLFEEMDLRTGVELEAVRDCSIWIGEQLGKRAPSAVSAVGGFPAIAA